MISPWMQPKIKQVNFTLYGKRIKSSMMHRTFYVSFFLNHSCKIFHIQPFGGTNVIQDQLFEDTKVTGLVTQYAVSNYF